MQIATPGMSEYQDGISKLGQVIIREKLHHRPRAPGRI